jgi:transposase
MATKQRWGKLRDATSEVCEAYRNGTSVQELAARFQVAESSIKRLLNRHGVERRPNRIYKLRKDQQGTVKKLYTEGKSTHEIGALLGLSHNAVLTLLDRLGVERRPAVESRRKYYRSPEWNKNRGLSTRKMYAANPWKLVEMSAQRQGIPLGEWKGFSHSAHERLRAGADNWQWRLAVFKRDNHTCALCHKRGGQRLNAHHIRLFSKHPKLRFDTKNGITLCESCHQSIRGKEEQYERCFDEIVESRT